MRKNKLWIMLLLLAALMLAACRGGNGGDGTPEGTPSASEPGSDTEPGTDAPDPGDGKLHLAENGRTAFSIVIPRSAEVSVERAANRLAAWFAEAGVTMPVMKDGGNFNKNVPTDTYEILLGATNRAESRAVKAEDIPENGYLWRASGRRLVIQAGSDALLEIAVGEVFGAYQSELAGGSLILDGDLSQTATPEARRGWQLTGIPDYIGGELSANLYDSGYGLTDYSEKPEQNSKMQIIGNTSVSEWEAYLEKLTDAGYRKTFENTLGSNRYTAWRKATTRLYVYYTGGANEARVIWDRNSTVDPDQFSYSYTPGTDDTSVYYAYAIYHGPTGLDYSNCGQMGVIKMADNSLFIIDGGMDPQFDTAAQEGFVRFAREVTGTPDGEKVRIACWFFTHTHGDHWAGLAKVMTSSVYQQAFSLERVAVNYVNAQIDLNRGIQSLYLSLVSAYPECQMLKLHTGMKLQLADLGIEVLYTHEDAVRSNGVTRITDPNDASTVLKLTMGGVTQLILGDLNEVGMNILIGQTPAEHLKVDIVQVSHHGWNWVDAIYDLAKAPYAIFPQSEGGANRTLGVDAKHTLLKVQEYAAPENCFYSDKTSSLIVKDGKITIGQSYPLYYDSPDYDWGNVYEGMDISKVKDWSFRYEDKKKP